MESKQPQRRHSKRIAITSTVVISIPNDDSDVGSFNGTVVNVSRGGLGLCTTLSLKKDLVLNVELKFIDPEGNRCEQLVEGRIAWQTEIAPFYIIGLEFNNQKDLEKTSLGQYLEVKENEASQKAPPHENQLY